MKVLDNGVAKITMVRSANWTYLLAGILGVVLALGLEVVVVWEFFVSSIGQAVALAVPAQLVVLVLLFFSSVHLGAYKRKKSFLLFFCRIEDANIKRIKEEQHICFIDEYGVVFVDKRDARLFSDWEFWNGIRSAREAESELFTEDDANETRAVESESL